jgi:hypothetical protein
VSYPIGITLSHITILSTLAQVGEDNYTQFRDTYNPWRRESYFDGQVKWLSRQGLVIITNYKTIQITGSGMELVQQGCKE